MSCGFGADTCHGIRPDNLDLLAFDNAQEGQEVLLLSDEIPVVSLGVVKYSHEAMTVVCAWRRSVSSGLVGRIASCINYALDVARDGVLTLIALAPNESVLPGNSH